MLIEASDLIYMKVGSHAGESLPAITARKFIEIQKAGFCLWGYGGSCCHPHTQVIPHCDLARSNGECIKICMEITSSVTVPKVAESSEYSHDGQLFEKLPESISVTGSKWALVIRSLEHVDAQINLDQYEVAIGSSAGRIATEYLKGRVDKACLRRRSFYPDTKSVRKIRILGLLQPPYAVYLR